MKRPEQLSSADVKNYMDMVIEEVKASKISSHVKADVIALLEYLRDMAVLSKVALEAKKSDVQEAAERGFNS